MMRWRSLVLAALALLPCACSVLLTEQAQQCERDSDCSALGFTGWVCNTSMRVCAKDPEATAGSAGSGGQAGGSSGAAPVAGGGNAGSGGNSGGAGGGGAGGSLGVAGVGALGGGGSGGNGGTAGSGGVAPVECDESACTGANGKCQMGVCVIACTTADCKPVCPAGMPCQVDCATSSCSQGVDCTKATRCDVTCGMSSCLGGVNCAGDSCSVHCDGNYSCSTTPIVCRAKACDISCPGLQSCKELKCLGDVSTCNFSCEGVQTCGTSMESAADKTTIQCLDGSACDAADNLCCSQGATCTGPGKPSCG